MFLKYLQSGDIVEIQDTAALFNPCVSELTGRFHHGEELQDEETFAKVDLTFPSGEALPKCWINANYRA